MKLPLSWLADYVDVSGISCEELADKLLNIGFEVEEIIRLGDDINGVVTGKILDIKKHDDADKLKVCMVDLKTEITTIVTGASNVKVGDIVPIATSGATLPNGKKIVAAPLRGVMSYGMMCSGAELNVDDSVICGAEVDGILILPNSTVIGEDIRNVLRLNEIIFDISVTANRPDCQCVYGMAREIAAVLGKKIKPLNLKYKAVPSKIKPTATVLDFERCNRYTATVIEDVKIKTSPDYVRDRLRYCGIRPINNLVDITNYVLLEVGQPLHAFDLALVEDSHIEVRLAKNNEKIVALDGSEYELNDKTLLICDKNKPIAIAGIMGGEYSGINENTKNVLLEAACFARGGIRASSRQLGLRSDSSARYEKGVDYFSVDVGRERALALFYQLKAGTVTSSSCRAEIPAPKQKVIKTTIDAINSVLGIKIKESVISKVLKNLEFGFESNENGITVTVPTFREDVVNFTDLAEEVIRFYGYDNLQATLLDGAGTTMGGVDVKQKNLMDIKTMLCGYGAYEITTYSFISPKMHDKLIIKENNSLRNAISILNPLSEEYSVMRTQLASNMLNTIRLNLSRKNKEFRLFEIGRRYIADKLPLEKLPDERETLCFSLVGDGDFYTIKEICKRVICRFIKSDVIFERSKTEYLHPGVSADVYANGVKLGHLGKVHPTVAKNFEISENVYLAEIDIESFVANEPIMTVYSQLPKFPVVERDFAVTVSADIPVGDMLKAVENADELCYSATLFDVYTGEQIEKGMKSVAFKVKLSLLERTLTDADILRATDNILSTLESNFGARLR